MFTLCLRNTIKWPRQQVIPGNRQKLKGKAHLEYLN